MSEKVIKLKVITPVRVLFDGEVESFAVKTRGEVGEFEVLYDHAPLVASVGLGTLVIKTAEGEEKTASLFGGYVVVQHNTAVIITEAAEWPEDIDLERAEESEKRAEERLKASDVDEARAEAALMRAVVRIQLYKSRK